MGILKTLLSLLIFSIPFGVIVRITPFENVSFYPHDVIAGTIFVIVIFSLIKAKLRVDNKKIFILASAFIGIGLISLIINLRNLALSEFLVSGAYLVRYASYLSLIFAFQFIDKEVIRRVGVKLLPAGSLFILFGYIQYFLYNNLRNLYYLGWDEHLYRLFSTFLDPNFAGSFLVLLLILISGKFLEEYKGKIGLNQLVYSGLFLLTLIAIFLTYSRSAFIMLIVASVALLLLYKKIKWLLFSLPVLAAIFFIFANTNFEGLNPFRIASIEARADSAIDALEIISKNPIIGVGFNAYRYAQERYGMLAEGDYFNNAGAGTDNSFLFVFATTGIIGLLVFVIFWLSVLKQIYHQVNKNNFLARVTFVSIICLFVNSIFINSLFYAPIMAWLFILVGVTLSKKR